MIRHNPMKSIQRPSDSGRGIIEATAIIQCVDGREPQIHDLWYLVLNGISCKVCTTSQVDVTAGTVGEVVTNNLAENRHRIYIIGQLSVNDRVQFWVCLTKLGEAD